MLEDNAMRPDNKAADKVLAMKNAAKLPHALLFVGDDGAATLETARYTAKLILCETGSACGVCRHCSRIDEGSHPDVIYPERTGKTLGYSIKTVRDHRADAYVRPNDCEAKLYIFADCEHFETEAQNAILKIMEDPPGDVYFIFTAVSKTMFLPTVLSRLVALPVETGGGGLPDGESLAAASAIIDALVADDEYAVAAALASIGENREKVGHALTVAAQIVRDACILRVNADRGGDEPATPLAGHYREGSARLSQRLSYNRAAQVVGALLDAVGSFRSNVYMPLAMSALSARLFDGC
jgi:DNA polymerase-3 subunit delta'